MVEGASLESLYMGNCIVGSNPILSARKAVIDFTAFFMRQFYFYLPQISLSIIIGITTPATKAAMTKVQSRFEKRKTVCAI